MPNGIEPVSDQQIKRSYWYLTHQEQLRKVGIGALFALCLLFWGYAIGRLSYLLLVEEPKTRAAVAALPEDFVAVENRSRYEALPLEVLDVDVFALPDGRADFYARVRNPNAMYAIPTLRYTFRYDGGETSPATSYVLPGSEMYLTALGVDVASPRNPQLVLENDAWKRAIGWEAIRASRFDFPISDLTVALLEGAGGGVRVQFTVANNTPYSFWSLDLPVLLSRGGRVVGVNTVRIEQLQSGESRPVALQWYAAPAGATTVRVVPQVNVLDSSVIQSIRGGEQRF